MNNLAPREVSQGTATAEGNHVFGMVEVQDMSVLVEDI